MKVTGIQLREAIKRWNLRKDTASTHFNESLWRFPDDESTLPKPQELAEQFAKAEVAVANLQTAQTRYNLAVTISVSGETMTLCDAVKRIGGAGRLEKMWRSATKATGRDNWRGVATTRSKDEVQARRMVSIGDALELATAAGKKAGDLRDAIAVGNTNAIEIEGLDPALLE